MSAWVHEVKQPLTAITNYASASKAVLSESVRQTVPVSEADARRIMQWIDEISIQTGRILKLVEEQNRLWEEHSLKQETAGGGIAAVDSPEITS